MTAHRRVPRILVVDDDVTTVRSVEAILRRAGFQTSSACDVATGLTSVRVNRPDLILLDVSLPDGSGFDLCRELHREPGAAEVPVLFISALEDVAAKVRGFEVGGVDYITKPVAAVEVLARVRLHLRLKRAYETLAELQAERMERLATAQKNIMPLPTEWPEARFEVALKQVLRAGGDFYDVISSGDTTVDYLVADASGHDLAATFWTAALKALVTEHANPVNSPTDVIRALNSALCRILPAGAFFTLLYARLNRQSGRLWLVNAGHPPAILIPAQGTEAVILHQEGDVVGAFPDAIFGVTERAVRTGDRLFLYSDGLVETGGSREHGIRQLADYCLAARSSPLAASVQAIQNEVTPGVTPQDDMLLLGVDV